jgi:hypothetical protein
MAELDYEMVIYWQIMEFDKHIGDKRPLFKSSITRTISKLVALKAREKLWNLVDYRSRTPL